jgi:hypothetical protein
MHPLVLEEAVKSGLFPDELTKDMLKLAKTYHKYNDHVTALRAAGEPPESLVINTKEVAQYTRDYTKNVLRILKDSLSSQ